MKRKIGKKEKNNNSLWVINTDFLHIDTSRGNDYKNKIPNRNITNEIARIVSSFSQTLRHPMRAYNLWRLARSFHTQPGDLEVA